MGAAETGEPTPVRRVDLHIGVEKTGTSTVQRALAEGRGLLAGQGVLYPTSPGRRSHRALAIVGRADEVTDDLRRGLGLRSAGDVRAYRRDVAAGLRDEVVATAPQRVVLSCEHCSSRLTTVAEVERLATWLDDVLGGELHVLVYLRRQDLMHESRHSTAVRLGAAETLSLPNERHMRMLYDFESLLERWATVVGEDRVVVRRFERHRLVGGDVLTDVAETLGLPPLAAPSAGSENRALDAPTQRFAALLNRHLPRVVDGRPDPLHVRVVAALNRVEPTGPPARLTTRERARLLADVAAGNDAVARRWFEGPPLFDEAWPAAGGDPDDLDVERAVAIAAQLLREVGGGDGAVEATATTEPEELGTLRRELTAARARIEDLERDRRVLWELRSHRLGRALTRPLRALLGAGSTARSRDNGTAVDQDPNGSRGD